MLAFALFVGQQQKGGKRKRTSVGTGAKGLQTVQSVDLSIGFFSVPTIPPLAFSTSLPAPFLSSSISTLSSSSYFSLSFSFSLFLFLYYSTLPPSLITNCLNNNNVARHLLVITQEFGLQDRPRCHHHHIKTFLCYLEPTILLYREQGEQGRQGGSTSTGGSTSRRGY